MNKQERVQEAVVEAIARATERAPSEVHESDELAALGLDSLDFSMILVQVEEAVGAEVPVELLDELSLYGRIETVGDVLAFLGRWNIDAPKTASSTYVWP